MSDTLKSRGSNPTGPAGARRGSSSGSARFADRWLSLDDFEKAARRRLPRALFGFIAGGAEREESLDANRSGFARYSLVPQVLRDTSARSPAVRLFGREYAAPFGIAPMGIVGLSAFRGDLALARACQAANVPMVLSAASVVPMEALRQAGAGWYQAYLPGDLGRIDALLDRVAAAGFEVLVVTVDVPVPANRENNVRNGFSVPLKPSLSLAWDGITHPRWLLGTALRTLLQDGLPHFENMDAERGPAVVARNVEARAGRRDRLTWEHISHIRRRWPKPLVLKGILRADDVSRARACGVDGLVVSNHGGRQLDGALGPLRALPAIKDAAGDLAVMLDGGIRRGTDVVKALALGADFVLAGRPFNYAVALGGEGLVRFAIDLLVQEIDRTMALVGAVDLADLDLTFVAGPNGPLPSG